MLEIKFDNHSPEAYLVFSLTFPFIKHESVDELDNLDDSLVNNQYDMYRCADICLNILKKEFIAQNVKIPDHYEAAHLIIMSRLLEEREKIKQLNK